MTRLVDFPLKHSRLDTVNGDISFTWTLHATLDRRLILCHFQVDTKLIAAAKPVPTVHDGEILKQQFLT